MHIAFLNPQGNFDPTDAYLTEHPDFGGQLVYVKETALAMADLGHTVDIVTRRVRDDAWPEFAADADTYPGYEDRVRILRFACGGDMFLGKEHLWPHMPEFVDAMLAFYGETLPDFFTAHYGDGGYCAVLAEAKTGIGFTFTGHSLGAQKMDKLGTTPDNMEAMEDRYRFSRRIAAERMSMRRAHRIITSTEQERREQYGHPLYAGAVHPDAPHTFKLQTPGVNTTVFNADAQPGDDEVEHALAERLDEGRDDPYVLVSSRLDEKKNIIGVVEAFARSEALREAARLAICIRGVDDPFADISQLPTAERAVLRPILDLIDDAGLRGRTVFLNIGSQRELAATYRRLAARGSVFALTAFYEPFGLAPIEAAACGLACVATQNGGPSEIFEDGSGVLVDPFDADDIARGLRDALSRQDTLSTQARVRVARNYTWKQTAKGYLDAIADTPRPDNNLLHPDATDLIRIYLEGRTEGSSP
jgi:sucrose-phosphate synthase